MLNYWGLYLTKSCAVLEVIILCKESSSLVKYQTTNPTAKFGHVEAMVWTCSTASLQVQDWVVILFAASKATQKTTGTDPEQNVQTFSQILNIEGSPLYGMTKCFILSALLVGTFVFELLFFGHKIIAGRGTDWVWLRTVARRALGARTEKVSQLHVPSHPPRRIVKALPQSAIGLATAGGREERSNEVEC